LKATVRANKRLPPAERLADPVPRLEVRRSRPGLKPSILADADAEATILGHGSAAFTLTVYGHLIDADLDDLAARLDLSASRPSRGQDGATVHRVMPNAEGTTP
jgi:hypothetical protein